MTVSAAWVLDLIVAGMALEGALLVALWHSRRRGIAPGALLPNLLSGMCLLLAMHAGLAGAPLGWIGFALFGALCFHLADLTGRWTNG